MSTGDIPLASSFDKKNGQGVLNYHTGDDGVEDGVKHPYVAYRSRWYVIATLAALNFSNAMVSRPIHLSFKYTCTGVLMRVLTGQFEPNSCFGHFQ